MANTPGGLDAPARRRDPSCVRVPGPGAGIAGPLNGAPLQASTGHCSIHRQAAPRLSSSRVACPAKRTSSFGAKGPAHDLVEALQARRARMLAHEKSPGALEPCGRGRGEPDRVCMLVLGGGFGSGKYVVARHVARELRRSSPRVAGAQRVHCQSAGRSPRRHRPCWGS